MQTVQQPALSRTDKETFDVIIAQGNLTEAYKRGRLNNRTVGRASAVKATGNAMIKDVREMMQAVSEEEQEQYLFNTDEDDNTENNP
jgi:hypothetical protein